MSQIIVGNHGTFFHKTPYLRHLINEGMHSTVLGLSYDEP